MSESEFNRRNRNLVKKIRKGEKAYAYKDSLIRKAKKENELGNTVHSRERVNEIGDIELPNNYKGERKSVSEYIKDFNEKRKHEREKLVQKLEKIDLYLALTPKLKFTDDKGEIQVTQNLSYDKKLAEKYFKGMTKAERRKKLDELRKDYERAKESFVNRPSWQVLNQVLDRASPFGYADEEAKAKRKPQEEEFKQIKSNIERVKRLAEERKKNRSKPEDAKELLRLW